MSNKKDCYEVLGIDRSASADEIKKAYRKLASTTHPDKGGDKEAFQEVQSAYDILSDANKKAHYDQYGHEQQGQGGHNPFSHFHHHFQQNFQQEVGESLLSRVELTLEEAASGIKRTVNYPRADKCDTCDGTGAKPGSKINTCKTCDGSGTIVMKQGPMQMMHVMISCPHCRGKGQVIEEPCSDCGGHGLARKDMSIEVTIPAGIDNGQQLRVHNRGNYGPDGYGHLVVQIVVKPHPTFERAGATLLTTKEIPFTTAILGGEITVKPLIGGEISVRVPAGTQPGQQLKVAGKGIKTLHHKTEGDMLIKVVVKIPKDLTSEQKELVQKYADIESSK